MSTNTEQEIILTGIGASPGICIGKAYLVDKEGVEVVQKYSIEEKDLESEINRFKAAVKKATDELHEIIENTPEVFRQHAYILETHMVLLKDKMLYGKTIDSIRNDRVNAEWALKNIVSNIRSIFQNISDPYLRERSADILQVSDRIMRSLTGAQGVNIAEIDKRVVLVAHDLSPADTSQIQIDRVMGFITDRGGSTSHSAIIARTLEIPAIMGLGNATDLIKNDDLIIVDGSAGIVIVRPSEKSLVEYEERKVRFYQHRAVISRDSYLPAETLDGTRLLVMGNIELPEEIVSVIDHGGDGIGLYRTEFQYLSRTDFPGEAELFERYKDVAEVMAPKPVTIRTLDINGDKALGNASTSDEENPALGLRAIRYCLKNPDVFKIQLRAILRAAAYGNVGVMFPMISSCDEILEAKFLLKEAADSLEAQGETYKSDIEVGILIEVPSAVVMAAEMAELVDFFSIGTNDLIQYALAIDRGNRQVAHMYHPLNPAILRMLKHVADVAKDKGLRIAMCGEMAGDPFHVPILLGLGINELSMNPQSIPSIKTMIRSLRIIDTLELTKEALKKATAKEIADLVQEACGTIISNKMLAA
ncbi:MAG: phosphoenolpyruvate--protein phosphotransferase [Deltaproteobacteria bacterium]|nr:phosphoenolpyruvate--protein phosphotransferase [Deltaproteobacteria bacterium]MBW2150710.1 phosphoenolpyruvate--protein phosphotransferase [Deltaproteobacteria bacterium]